MLDVVILEFQRSPRLFFECMLTSDSLLEHREAMLAVGRTCVFAEGVKLLATPGEVNDILYAVSRTSTIRFDDGAVVAVVDLRARHVVVSLSLEATFLQALAATPGTGVDRGRCRDNVKIKRRVVVAFPLGPRVLVACPHWPWLCSTFGYDEILGVDDMDDEDTDDDDDDYDIDIDEIVAMSIALAVSLDVVADDDEHVCVRLWRV
jgi:hypothetical protein